MCRQARSSSSRVSHTCSGGGHVCHIHAAAAATCYIHKAARAAAVTYVTYTQRQQPHMLHTRSGSSSSHGRCLHAAATYVIHAAAAATHVTYTQRQQQPRTLPTRSGGGRSGSGLPTTVTSSTCAEAAHTQTHARADGLHSPASADRAGLQPSTPQHGLGGRPDREAPPEESHACIPHRPRPVSPYAPAVAKRSLGGRGTGAPRGQAQQRSRRAARGR